MPEPSDDPTRTAIHTSPPEPETGGTAGETFPAEVNRLLDRLGLQSVAGEAPTAVAPAGYEIEAELGRGAMGVVYKARQTALNRTVALKMILSGAHASPLTQARFTLEAEAVAAIRHPHVVEVFDFGRADGLPYFALEYVDGGTLADRLANGPRPKRYERGNCKAGWTACSRRSYSLNR
jgi:serine/threonine protein kinase